MKRKAVGNIVNTRGSFITWNLIHQLPRKEMGIPCNPRKHPEIIRVRKMVHIHIQFFIYYCIHDVLKQEFLAGSAALHKIINELSVFLIEEEF